MRLYTNLHETKVLLEAVKLMKAETQKQSVEDICDRLITRIETCMDLQHPDCDRKGTTGDE